MSSRQFKDLLNICEDQEKKDRWNSAVEAEILSTVPQDLLIEKLHGCDEGWWVTCLIPGSCGLFVHPSDAAGPGCVISSGSGRPVL